MLVIHALLRWITLLWVSLRRKAALLVIRLQLGVLCATGAGVLVDRRGIGGRWGGVLLLHFSRAVHVPSERWGKNTKAGIHVDNTDLRDLECWVLVDKAEERVF